ncbi:hypothetical protein KKF34_11545 [Myxococcota bacterium]|nr:hypothetical protein [Myxococcota bacterium]MBU1497497.1 hypothetical protein [Myxococcota bacterium]
MNAFFTPFPLTCAAAGGAGKGEKKGAEPPYPRAEALGYLEAFYERGKSDVFQSPIRSAAVP